MTTVTTCRFVNVAPGVDIYTERRTLSTTHTPTQTIVFIHGLGGSINSHTPMFSSFLRAFPDSTLVGYDFSGNGLSPYPAQSRPRPSWDDFVTDFDKIIHLEVPEGPFIIVAHSAGSHLASRWATSSRLNSPHPARVKSFVFIGGPMNMPLPEATVVVMKQMSADILSAGTQSVVELLIQRGTGPKTITERPLTVALMRAIMLSHSREGYAALMDAWISAGFGGPMEWDRMPKSNFLFVGGMDDIIVKPDVLRSTADRFEGSKFVTVDAAHYPTMENPLETANAIIDFLREL